jgi:phage anti-repressor protein
MNELSIPEEFAAIASILQLDAQLLGDHSIRAVNGRQLQEALGNVKNHTAWAQQQVSSLSLEHGKDYEILSNLSFPSEASAKSRAQSVLTYCFTVDTGKTIAMVSKSQNGARVRRYFLHMENIAQKAYQGELPRQLSDKAGAEESASYQMDYLSRGLSSAMMAGGWSEGYRQKQVYLIAEEVDRRHGTSIKSMLPPISVALPGANEEVDHSKGFHAMHKQIGGDTLNTQQMLDGIAATGVTWHKLMLKAGYVDEVRSQNKRVKRSGIKRSAKCPVEWATQAPMPTGHCAGQPNIISWHYDMIPQAVRVELKELAERLGAKK